MFVFSPCGCCPKPYSGYYYAPSTFGPVNCITAFPTTCSNKGVGGALAWSNPNNATAVGGSSAIIPFPTVVAGSVPDTIVANGFSFSIPAGSLIVSLQALIWAEALVNPATVEQGFIPKITFAGTDYFPTPSTATWLLGAFGPYGSGVMTTGLPSVTDINAGANAEFAFNAALSTPTNQAGLALDAVGIQICYQAPL